MRLRLFVFLTICGFLIFALTMTFVPVLQAWANYAARAGFLVIFGALWWAGRDERPLSRFRPSRLFGQLLQALIELSEAGSEERSLLETISNHLKERGVQFESGQEEMFEP